jgi:hypothetical protein
MTVLVGGPGNGVVAPSRRSNVLYVRPGETFQYVYESRRYAFRFKVPGSSLWEPSPSVLDDKRWWVIDVYALPSRHREIDLACVRMNAATYAYLEARKEGDRVGRKRLRPIVKREIRAVIALLTPDEEDE